MAGDEADKKILANFLDSNGKVITIPRKQKNKIILLEYLSSFFLEKKVYSENEINEEISSKFEDYVTVRRYLIEYEFFERTNDGKKYWRKK